MDLGLTDKRALITGASRGLGYAIALVLAREGCLVAVNSRNEKKVRAAAEKISTDTSANIVGLSGDVSDPSVPEKLIAQVVKILGGLDLLVTNAGGLPAGAFESFDEASWEKAVNLSFMSHMRLIRAALPHLRTLARRCGSLEYLFVLISFGNLLGVPILPPYYSMRLLPFIVPLVNNRRRRMLRERDLIDAIS